MTTPMSYDGSVAGTTSYINQIATMAVVAPDDSNFVTILPQMIVYAELRMYRDLDFLFTSGSSTAYSLTAGSRILNVNADTFPYGTLVVPEQINVLIGSSNPDLATRVPLLPTTKEFLDAVYGSGAIANRDVPQYWVPFDDYTFLVGPYPDISYPVEIVGTYRPASLSSTNLTTFISLNLPDVMIMASMVYISAYQRNFGRMNDDPQMAISYESQYQTLLKGAMGEENRKKFEAAAWSSQAPSPTATPTRG